jgi:8-oxo-dGTP diphosphatase
LAAGGIVERSVDGAPQVAVVHRTRYRDSDGGAGDWVLPKGKLDAGETLAEAALREVREEAGCWATIVGPAFFSEYAVGDVPKVTIFFLMRYEEEAGDADESEVRSVHWLSPPNAIARLTYDKERSILEDAYPGEAASEDR